MVSKRNSNLSVLYTKLDGWSIKPAQFLIIIVLLAALMNGYLFINNPNMGSDALYYHSAFHNVITGKGLTNYYWDDWAPGYGLLSYLFFLLIRDIELSGMLVSAFAYLLMIPTVYFNVNFLFGKRSALLASFLITFWPTFISYSYISLTDCVFTFFLFICFSLYTKLLLDRITILRSALLGSILGSAYLIRVPEGLSVAFFVILSLFVLGIANLKHVERKQPTIGSFAKLFLAPIIVLLGFLVFSMPYVVLIQARTGSWSFSNRISSVVEATQVTSDITAPQVNSGISTTPAGSSTDVAQVVPSMSITQTASSTNAAQVAPSKNINLKVRFLEPIVSYVPSFINIVKNVNVLIMRLVGMNIHALAPLALLGIIIPFLSPKKLFIRPRPGSRKLRLVLSFGIFSSPVLLLLLVTSRLDSRYLMPYFVYILIAVAFLTVRFLERLLESFGRKPTDMWVILLCLISLVISLGFGSPTLSEALTARHAHLGLRAAGLWLQDNVQNPDDLSIIAPRKSAIALLYASGKNFSVGSSRDFYPLDMSLEAIGDLVNAGEINYLLLDNYYASFLPQLTPLWNDPEMAHEYGLSLLHQDSSELFQIYTRSKAP